MSDDKRNSSSGSNQPDALTDLVDLADRTLDRTFKGVSKIVHDYGGEWNDTISDTLTSSLPSLVWGGRDQFNKKRDEWLGEFLDTATTTSTGSADGGVARLPLDTTKPTNIWAFPVPSTKQYANCKELNGTSAWTRDGVWRCLFPQSQAQLDQELQLSRTPTTSSSSSLLSFNKPAAATSEEAADADKRRLFPDYTSYLDWKVIARKALAEKRVRERDQWDQNERHRLSPPSHDDPRKAIVHVSEAEAEKNGKRIISSSVSSETVTKDDGTLETRKVVQKYYDDGTSSVTENVYNSKQKDSRGWFWK